MFKSTKWPFIVTLFLLAVVGLTACATAASAEENQPAEPSATRESAEPTIIAAPPTATPGVTATPAPPADTPEDAIQSFYESYLDYGANNCCFVGMYRSPLHDGIYRDSPYMTDDLKTRIDETVASMGPVGYDPILCAQNWPEWIRVWDVAVEGDGASATVETSLYAADGRYQAFPVQLERGEEGWQLAEIDCLTEVTDSERPDITKEPDWQTYTDADYGFSFSYPSGWAAQEAVIVGEDAPALKVVTFAPEDWTGMMAPLSVEVSPAQGEIEHTSTFEAEGHTVYVLDAPNGEVFYTLEGPEGFRVAVRDGALMAAGGDADLASTWEPFGLVMVYGIAGSFD